MTTARHSTTNVGVHQVIATVDADALQQLRKAIEGVSLPSVTVTSVASLSVPGRQLCYRGQRYTDSRKVSRVEIICADDQVDGIVAEIERIATGRVVAFALGAQRI
jgi:nitrogen regulatory protein PII